ncbi:MAG: 30S ribosomal protein S20 [Clostridia bacterium]|nr:30S ribosomal protein S20 [Clostridia bacterium]
MPNIKSAKKRVITAETRRQRNVQDKSVLRKTIKKARIAIVENAENKDELVKKADISLDKAASKGLIHKNNAARKKSRLAKSANKQEADKA